MGVILEPMTWGLIRRTMKPSLDCQKDVPFPLNSWFLFFYSIPPYSPRPLSAPQKIRLHSVVGFFLRLSSSVPLRWSLLPVKGPDSYCLSRAQRGESILSQLCWWKICLSRSAQWDKVIEIEPAIHACYATQGTCLSRLVALPWISKDISLHHCATDVRLYVWPYRIFLVTQTTNRVLGSSFLAKRSLCSLVLWLFVG